MRDLNNIEKIPGGPHFVVEEWPADSLEARKLRGLIGDQPGVNVGRLLDIYNNYEMENING